MMKKLPNYQLSLALVREFIEYTRQSGYYIKNLNIHGIGEPLLWTHFNEGVNLLAESGVVGRIVITTSGDFLDRIQDKTWKNIYLVKVSLYPHFKKRDMLDVMRKRWEEKISILNTDSFSAFPKKRYPETRNGICYCPGPMYYDGMICLSCGPVVFNSYTLALSDPDRPNMYVPSTPIGVNYLKYLEDAKKDVIGRMNLCEYCQANGSIASILESEKHKQCNE
jgi:hypothetical protein